MAGHFDKSFTAKDLEMARYLVAVRAATKHFLGITVQTIPRGSNEAADRLAKLASSDERPPPEVFYDMLRAPSAAPEGATPKAQGVAPKEQEAGHLVLLINEAD